MKIKIPLLLVACWVSFNMARLYCAGPTTHIYFAELWLAQRGAFPSEQEKKSFLLGTSFPDIRYLPQAQLQRDQTHEYGLTIEDILACKDPFIAGKKFHSFIDGQRELFIRQYKMYPKLDVPKEQKPLLLKILEDALLSQHIDIPKIVLYLETIDQGELDTGVSLDTLREWHRRLVLFITMPQDNLIDMMINDHSKKWFTVDDHILKIWRDRLPTLMQEPEVLEYLLQLIQHFETLFNAPDADSFAQQCQSAICGV